jgi:hypothetical protein
MTPVLRCVMESRRRSGWQSAVDDATKVSNGAARLYHSERKKWWLEMKNPLAPAVRREREAD